MRILKIWQNKNLYILLDMFIGRLLVIFAEPKFLNQYEDLPQL